MRNYTDTELIEFLEEQNKKSKYTGKCVFRWSNTGKGWRLHETSDNLSFPTVRQAILSAIEDSRDI